MANVFKPKRSNTASSVPTTSDIVDGELAVNSADQKIYIRDGGTIVEVANVDSGISNVVEDTTPQLGGTLDINGNLIQFGDSGSATDDRLQFGASQDLQIYHNGTENVIHSTVSGANLQLRQTGTGSVVVYGDSPRLDFNDVTGGTQIDFRLQANNGDFVISDISNSDNVFKYDQNAGVKLYYDGTTTFETTTNGISVSGIVTAISGVVTYYGDGSNLTGISGGISNVVEDTTPQLGGTLDTNGNIIQFGDSGSGTDDRLKFGAGQDLQIYHNGTNSYISDFGTGELRIISNALQFRNTSDTASMLTATQAGSVELYNNGSKKFETTSTGGAVTGTLTATEFVGNVTGIASTATTVQATENTTNTFYRIPFLSADTGNVSVYTDSGIKYNPSTNELVAATRQVNLVANNSNDETVYLTFADAATAGQELETDTALTYNPSKNQLTVGIVTGATYYGDGSNLTGISAGGISNVVEDTTPQLGGTLDANGNLIDLGDSGSAGENRLRFGLSADLQIYHSSTNSHVRQQGTGDLIIDNTTNDLDVIIQSDDGSGGTADYFRADGSTGESLLYHYGSEKLATKSNGIDVTGHTETDTLNVSGVSTFQDNVDLGDNDRVRFGAGNDLQIWHNGANSYISQSSDVGDLYLTSLNDDNDVIIQTDSGDGNTVDYFRADGSTGETKLFYYGSEKIKTINTGVSVTGIITASGDIQTDGAFRAESSNSTERFEIAYNETTDSLDFSYFAS